MSHRDDDAIVFDKPRVQKHAQQRGVDTDDANAHERDVARVVDETSRAVRLGCRVGRRDGSDIDVHFAVDHESDGDDDAKRGACDK